jgi:hypothetical protein
MLEHEAAGDPALLVLADGKRTIEGICSLCAK